MNEDKQMVKEIHNMWYYFLELEKDLSDSSRYIEPSGQENVYSFEFRKIIILACTEFENISKTLCKIINDTAPRGNMKDYKATILKRFPKIIESETIINRWHNTIKPFVEWSVDGKHLEWWDAYNSLKHDNGAHIKEATYKNAVYALSAVYLLILYLARHSKVSWERLISHYITSQYAPHLFVNSSKEDLPDW